MTKAKGGRGPGRPKEHRLSEDLAIACALSREHTTTSYADLADLLQIGDEDRVKEVVAGLSEGAGPDGTDAPYVALIVDDDGRITVSSSGSENSLKGLRLSVDQANACCQALDRLGIPRSDSRRAGFEERLYPTGFETPPQTQRPLLSESEFSYLRQCALSIVGAEPGKNPDYSRQEVVKFTYKGENDVDFDKGKPCHGIPLAINLKEGSWSVDMFDMEAHGVRTYQLGRISELDYKDTRAEAVVSKPLWDDDKYVEVTCLEDDYDYTLHILLSLDGAVESAPEDGKPRVRVPYERRDWLPRQLMALHGKIKISGRGEVYRRLRDEMRSVAKHDLAEAKKVRARKTQDS